MTCASEYAPKLRSRGFRVTPQRMTILHVLRHARTHLSPAEVYERARLDLPRLTETTVYRTLGFLAKTGLVWPTHRGNGHLVYEIAGSYHHHLVCRACGSELEVESALLRNMYAKLAAATGYVLMDNHVTLFGLCPKCQKKNPRKGAA